MVLENFLRILNMLKPYVVLVALAPMMVIVEVCAELVQPFLMARIVNDGIIGGDESVVWLCGLKMLLVTIIGVIGGLGSIYAAGKVSANLGADVRFALFEKVHVFSMADIYEFRKDSLVTRVTDDVSRLQHVVQASMRLVVRAPFLFVGSVFMVFTFSRSLSLVLLLLMPLLLFVVFFILKKVTPMYYHVQAALDNLNRFLIEAFSGIRVVKSFVCEDFEGSRFSDVNAEFVNVTLKVSRWVVFLMPIVSLLMNIGVVIVIWFGAKIVSAGGMQIGDVLACTNYLLQILLSLLMASLVFKSVSQAQASVVRIFEVLDKEQPERETLAVKPKDASVKFANVSLDNLSLGKEKGKMLLSDVSFEVKCGETLVVLGETGSGKSLLINLIAGVCEASAGVVEVGGVPVNNISSKVLCKHVGVVPQNPKILAGTISDYLCLGNKSASLEDMREVCRIAEIMDFIEEKPDGFDYVLELDGANLSGGQKQRLNIAAVLLAKPEIIVFDDAFSALDAKTGLRIRSELAKCKATKIMVEHSVGSAIYADKVLLLKDGKVAGFGPHESLMQHNDVYRDFCFSKTGE